MTFAPTKKMSKSNTRARTTAWIKRTAKKLEDKTALNSAGNGLAHFVDSEGMYKGRLVVPKKTKKKNVTRV